MSRNFHEITAGTDIFDDLADVNISVEKRTNLFLQKLNTIFNQTFKKIRINNRIQSQNSTDEYLKVKSRLKKQLKNCQNKDIKIFIEKKIETVDEIISQDCAEENTRKVNEWLDCLESENGGFSQNGMWKLKSKLFPRPKFDKMETL